MGHSIIVKGADFSSSAIPVEELLTVFASVEGIRVVKESSGSRISIDNISTYQGYSYCVPVANFVGRQIKLTFCLGYASTILANGGFVASLPNGMSLTDGWSVASNTALSFISDACVVESSESNTWVSKTYTIPSGASYLLFTSKYNNDGEVGVELVEETP